MSTVLDDLKLSVELDAKKALAGIKELDDRAGKLESRSKNVQKESKKLGEQFSEFGRNAATKIAPELGLVGDAIGGIASKAGIAAVGIGVLTVALKGAHQLAETWEKRRQTVDLASMAQTSENRVDLALKERKYLKASNGRMTNEMTQDMYAQLGAAWKHVNSLAPRQLRTDAIYNQWKKNMGAEGVDLRRVRTPEAAVEAMLKSLEKVNEGVAKNALRVSGISEGNLGEVTRGVQAAKGKEFEPSKGEKFAALQQDRAAMSLQASFNDMGNSIKTMMLQIGETFAPVVRFASKLIETFTKLVGIFLKLIGVTDTGASLFDMLSNALDKVNQGLDWVTQKLDDFALAFKTWIAKLLSALPFDLGNKIAPGLIEDVKAANNSVPREKQENKVGPYDAQNSQNLQKILDQVVQINTTLQRTTSDDQLRAVLAASLGQQAGYARADSTYSAKDLARQQMTETVAKALGAQPAQVAEASKADVEWVTKGVLPYGLQGSVRKAQLALQQPNMTPAQRNNAMLELKEAQRDLVTFQQNKNLLPKGDVNNNQKSLTQNTINISNYMGQPGTNAAEVGRATQDAALNALTAASQARASRIVQ